jgi:hypothetical protein
MAIPLGEKLRMIGAMPGGKGGEEGGWYIERPVG